MDGKLDIIVFGATGFTGKHTFPYLHKLCRSDGRELRWGIAGRSEAKLKEVLAEYAQKLGTDALKSTPIVIADITDELSILEMAKKARIIINCCGPYGLYGEVVVKACVTAGTHYVDVTGETYFQQLMMEKYEQRATEKDTYIVFSCGLNSIVRDAPLIFIMKNFQGTLNSVELFTNLNKNHNSGPVLNIGTWASFVNTFAEFKLEHLFKKTNKLTSLPKTQPFCSLRFPFSRNGSIGIPNKRVVPFSLPGGDLLERSQRFFYENDGKRPIQVRHYFLMESWTTLLLMMFFGLIMIIFSQFGCGRKLLLKYPELFSGGYFDHESPSEEMIKTTQFDVYFYGKGWSGIDGENNQFKMPPNKSVLGKINVVNPGYGFTCLAVVLSAITILTEPEKLPKRGGIYTAVFAFFKTSLVEQMQRNGVKLEILSVKDLQ